MNTLHIWKRIFKKFISSDFNKKLTRHELENPSSEIVYALLFIYSMETFVYSVVNKGTRDHDRSKIHTLGPYARALRWIVDCTE